MAKKHKVMSQDKRAIPLGLIFSRVSAIGGLIMKGVNTWSNYKKSKTMTKVVEKLYKAQEIDHRQLTRLEGQTSLLARTTKTAFQHISVGVPRATWCLKRHGSLYLPVKNINLGYNLIMPPVVEIAKAVYK